MPIPLATLSSASASASPEPKRRVAVVGSGLAGLTAAHFLQRGGYHVELFEKGSSVGMDAASITVDSTRIDVPFRVIIPSYYPYLTAIYKHLGIEFASADYSMEFSSDSSSVWSYTNLTLGDFQMPVPDGLGMGDVGVTRDWMRIGYACIRFMRRMQTLSSGSTMKEEDEVWASLRGKTIGEYLVAEGYGEDFVQLVFLPFLASMFTCSLASALQYPADTVLHFVAKAAFGARLRKARDGVQRVCQELTHNLRHIHLNTTVDRIEIPEPGNITLVCQGTSHRFDALVVATPADTAAKLVAQCKVGEGLRYPPKPLVRALRAVPYEDAHVVTHGDKSVMPAERAQWRGVNLRTDSGHGRATATIWINYAEMTGKGVHMPGGDLFQTVDPSRPLEHVKSNAEFHRSLLTLESQRGINDLHCAQGECGVWFVGAYTAPGVPLLEGCVRMAVEVVQGMGVDLLGIELPPPPIRRGALGRAEYAVGLAPGLVRGEAVEAFFECDSARTFAFQCPPVHRLVDALGKSSLVDVRRWAARLVMWAAWQHLLPLVLGLLATIYAALGAVLGTPIAAHVRSLVLGALAFILCVVLRAYRLVAA
ncbi:hypothetical protein LPJ66_009289 [Kickxella alabastrina]|uniref:Uncharacterized protein n=1 Tax=Kickxella alabastrina TaxID=61397 RepID=A0ACC1I7F0_9FUNG|nr:hypothetical protein LPJ66_009289 [Kickxella alabastrina]